MKSRFYFYVFAFMFFFSFAHGQTTYDFRDGTIIANGKSADGSLKLSGGSYSYHSAQYGLNMKVGGLIQIAINGSNTLKFLGSKYSGLNLQGISKLGVNLGTQPTKVTNDLVDTYDFVYTGVADSLKFTTVAGTGNDLYLPTIQVIPPQAGGDATLLAALKNVIYYFDLRDGSIIPNQTSLNGNYTINQGLFKIESGTSNAYGYNGTQHGSILKTGNRITLKVAGNCHLKIGGSMYSNGTISVSSTTGVFDKASQASKTAANYSTDGSNIDFLYVGTAGEVVLDFTGTTYIPIIQVIPVPYDVQLIPWVQKSGQIVVNGVAVNLTAGATITSNPSVTVDAGTVISATPDIASIRINMGGKSLANVATSFSGNISAVSVSGDTLKITYADTTTKPYSYRILVSDNSATVSAQAGKTYSYMFMDGSVFPQISYSSLRYSTFITPDGILTLNSNTTTAAQQFGYHDSAHGIVMFSGNSMNFVVAGNATITFSTCMYGAATDAVFNFTDAAGNALGTVQGTDKGTGIESTHSFAYTGPSGVITATLSSALAPTGEFYIHGVSVENAASIVKTSKTDVWDFGAALKDTTLYNNRLTADVINSWYPGVTAGTSGKSLPTGFTVGVLSWVGGTNSDRIRTSNTNLTRYDANSCPAYVAADTLTGLLYVNSSASSARYIGLTLSADDEVTVYAKSQNGIGKLNFQYMADATQKDIAPITSTVGIVKFVAKKSGAYHIFDSADKPFYYRILRKDATYATLSGTLNLTDAAGIPSGYSVVLTNAAGKSWSDTIPSGTNYSVKVPAGYTYSLSLANASGYIITNGAQVTVTGNATHEIAIKKVVMYNVTGAVTGLPVTLLPKVLLTYTPTVSKIYVPQPAVDATAGTYAVKLEPGCTYKITAAGVNDYYIPVDTISIKGDSIHAIAFAPKPVFKVSVITNGLDSIQRAKLNVTFTNLNEAGYSYSFNKLDSMYLRNGVYKITCSGLDQYPLQLGPTSNVAVNGAITSKTLAFVPVTDWSFDDATITSGTTTAYKGMLFTGTVSNEIAKGHLVLTGTGTAQVPVNPGQKVVITYYYSAKFVVVPGDTVKTSSGSTSTFESKEYIYSGSVPGYMTITNITGTSSYLTDVAVAQTLPYAATISVGVDKNYQTINAALAAVRAMVRPNLERVKIMIDPGNYEEMLNIDVANVSLINAATTPSIALANKGVDIDPNAVRITSYYGHGYNYFSMGTDQKWSADALRVNKENGYTTYSNTGSGTTNGSYWNATVVVSAGGFEASNIIFENSYNQYISKKEAADVVQEWASGGKGTRPTDYGNTSVQNKSFVERAAAIAYTKSGDRSVLNKCRVVGRQDSFYGAEGARVVAYKGSLMGGTDYIFGGMTLVAYKSNLAMNTSEVSTDVSYITAAQQNTSRGYLMYACTVTSAIPGTETASTFLSKPGEFGRPWQATTSEVVFYNTTIEVTNNPDYAGKSLIAPEGWLNSLGGTSSKMYEFGTIELSGENNQASRASWSTILTAPTLNDGTAITTLNFTKGTDNWDPIPDLIAADNSLPSAFNLPLSVNIRIHTMGNQVLVSNIKSNTHIGIFGIDGSLFKSIQVNGDCQFQLPQGLWIADVNQGGDILRTKILIK